MNVDNDGVLNQAIDGGNVVQAHTVNGGVHFYNSATPHEVPLIVSVEDRTDQSHLIVDGDPPRKIALSSSPIVVTVEARSAQAVILERMRPVVLERRVPRWAASDLPEPGVIGAAIMPIRIIDVDLTAEALGLASADLKFDADLNSDTPSMSGYSRKERSEQQREWLRKRLAGGGFPYTVTAGDPERFEVRPRVENDEVTWELQLDWLHAGRRGTTVINKKGEPFELYPEQGGVILHSDGMAQLLARWSGWPSSGLVEDLWSRYYTDDDTARVQASSEVQVDQDETTYLYQLERHFHDARELLSRFAPYLEPSRVGKIEADLEQAQEMLAYFDPIECQRMINLLESDIYGSGLASQLYVAERETLDGKRAGQVHQAIAAVQEAFEEGKYDSAREQALALMHRLFPWHSPS